jgi:hypothetical protein
MKRFFLLEDNGETYYIVATDQSHAESILKASSVVFVADVDKYRNGVAPLEWSEMSPDRAAMLEIVPATNADFKPDPELGGDYGVPKTFADYELGRLFSASV